MPHPLERDLNHVLAHTSSVWQSLRGQQIFIAGGTGFVGTWLLESFAWANDHMDLNAQAFVLTRNPQAFREKSPYAARHPSVLLIQGSLRDFTFPERECPFVIHAVSDQVQPSKHEPAGAFDRELTATRRILDLARACGARRLLLTSSGAVYGRQPSKVSHVPEEFYGSPSPVELGSAYGEAKRASEFLCAAHASQFDFTAVIARLFAFAGPYLPLNSNFAIGNFVRDALAGGPVRISGDGTAHRSYLYAADLAIWLWHMLVRGESARPYNVGSPEAITIADLARKVVETCRPGIPIQIAQLPVPAAPATRYVPSVERAKNELGLQSLIPLNEQIRRMYEWNAGLRSRASCP